MFNRKNKKSDTRNLHEQLEFRYDTVEMLRNFAKYCKAKELEDIVKKYGEEELPCQRYEVSTISDDYNNCQCVIESPLDTLRLLFGQGQFEIFTGSRGLVFDSHQSHYKDNDRIFEILVKDSVCEFPGLFRMMKEHVNRKIEEKPCEIHDKSEFTVDELKQMLSGLPGNAKIMLNTVVVENDQVLPSGVCEAHYDEKSNCFFITPNEISLPDKIFEEGEERD